MPEGINFEMTLNDLVSMRLREADGNAKKFETTMDHIQRKAGEVGGALAAAFAIDRLFDYGQDVVETGAKLETLNNVINYTSLDAKDAAANHAFLKHMIDDYKLPLIETTEGFSQFSASLMGTKLQGQGARDVFEGVSTAVTAMHLDAEKANRVFLSLNQMMSKGTVQSEELKGQMGEALPGSFKLAAQAMGMTTAELTKAMQGGEVMAEDFLPRFAAILKKEYGAAIPAAVDSTTSAIVDFKNESIELKEDIFEDAQPAIKGFYQELKNLVSGLREAWGWARDNKEILQGVAEVAGVVAAAYIGYKSAIWGAAIAQLAMNAYTITATTLTEIMVAWDIARAEGLGVVTAAQWALNVAMDTNPIGLLIAGVAALVGGFYLAYKHSETFRAALSGLWEMAKTLGDMFYGLGEIIYGAFIVPDFNMVKKGLADTAAAASDLGSSFSRGYNESLKESENAKKEEEKGESTVSKTVNDSKNKKTTFASSPPTTKEKTSKVTGTKSVNISIKIDSLLKGGVTINTTNLKDGYGKIESELTRLMLSVVNNSQHIAES